MAQFVTAQEAVKHIPNGSRVVLAHSTGEPKTLVQAMVDNYEQYKDVEVCHMLGLGPYAYTNPEMKGHLWHNSLFIGPGGRKAFTENRLDFTPGYFCDSIKFFREGYLPVDVVMMTVSPPDKHGYVTCGITCDFTMPALQCAKMVIVQVNKNMPRTFGQTAIHLDDIDFAVEADDALYGSVPGELSDIDRRIGEHCASLIQDGACLQLGIGGIPNAVLTYLTEKNDMGVHSEMLSDGILHLIKSGNINNRRKQIHVGKSAVTFLNGSQELYDYVDDNPSVEFYPVDYINNPYVIGQNDNMVSVNSCLSVDLMGQIVADNLSATRQFSGAGGFVDFVRGATNSKGGISIVAMPSTAAGGKASRIEMMFEAGRPITLSRFESFYVVTEFGVALLRGKSLRQRARALIEIAHPDFRDEMREFYEKRFNEKY